MAQMLLVQTLGYASLLSVMAVAGYSLMIAGNAAVNVSYKNSGTRHKMQAEPKQVWLSVAWVDFDDLLKMRRDNGLQPPSDEQRRQLLLASTVVSSETTRPEPEGYWLPTMPRRHVDLLLL